MLHDLAVLDRLTPAVTPAPDVKLTAGDPAAEYLSFDGAQTVFTGKLTSGDERYQAIVGNGFFRLIDSNEPSFDVRLEIGNNVATLKGGVADLRLEASEAVVADSPFVANVGVIVNASLELNLTDLPTKDPSIAGRVWRDGTDLRISTG